jgi:hypothetical protein
MRALSAASILVVPMVVADPVMTFPSVHTCGIRVKVRVRRFGLGLEGEG